MGGIFKYKIITKYSWAYTDKTSTNWSTFDQVLGKNWLIIWQPCVLVQCPAKKWSIRPGYDIWQTATVVTTAKYNVSLILTVGMINIKQITNWHHKRMCYCYAYAKALCCDTFLLDRFRCTHSTVMWVFGVATLNFFLSVNQIMIKSLDKYFSATVLSKRDLYGCSFHWTLEHGR